MLGLSARIEVATLAAKPFRVCRVVSGSAARCGTRPRPLKSRINNRGVSPCVSPSSSPARRRSLSAWPVSPTPRRPRRRSSPLLPCRRPRPARSPSRRPRSSSSTVKNNVDEQDDGDEDHDHLPEHAEDLDQGSGSVHGVRRRAASPTPASARRRRPARAPRAPLAEPVRGHPGPLSSRSSPFVGKNEVLFLLSGSADAVLHGKISGKKMTIVITPAAAAAGPGRLLGAATTSATTISKKKGKNSLITSRRLQVQEAHDRRHDQLRRQPEPAGAPLRVEARRREVLVVRTRTSELHRTAPRQRGRCRS